MTEVIPNVTSDANEDDDRVPTQCPCAHNAWDNTRFRNGIMVLRCRLCQLKWKVFRPVPCDVFVAFQHCPRGDSCSQPHIYKTRQIGRRAWALGQHHNYLDEGWERILRQHRIETFAEHFGVQLTSEYAAAASPQQFHALLDDLTKRYGAEPYAYIYASGLKVQQQVLALRLAKYITSGPEAEHVHLQHVVPVATTYDGPHEELIRVISARRDPEPFSMFSWYPDAKFMCNEEGAPMPAPVIPPCPKTPTRHREPFLVTTTAVLGENSGMEPWLSQATGGWTPKLDEISKLNRAGAPPPPPSPGGMAVPEAAVAAPRRQFEPLRMKNTTETVPKNTLSTHASAPLSSVEPPPSFVGSPTQRSGSAASSSPLAMSSPQDALRQILLSNINVLRISVEQLSQCVNPAVQREQCMAMLSSMQNTIQSSMTVLEALPGSTVKAQQQGADMGFMPLSTTPVTTPTGGSRRSNSETYLTQAPAVASTPPAALRISVSPRNDHGSRVEPERLLAQNFHQAHVGPLQHQPYPFAAFHSLSTPSSHLHSADSSPI